MNAHTLPGYVLGLVKDKGQPLQMINAFETPVRSKNGLMVASIDALKEHHEQLKKTWGSNRRWKSPSPTGRSTSFARRS
jgi:CRISPR system Cascade subunit CasC